MSASPGSDAIRFYFSFRSPYAWIATERAEDERADLGVEVERVFRKRFCEGLDLGQDALVADAARRNATASSGFQASSMPASSTGGRTACTSCAAP